MLTVIGDKIAGFSASVQTLPVQQLAFIRKSQSLRSIQSRQALPLVIGAGLVILLSLWREVNPTNILIWVCAISATSGFRSWSLKAALRPPASTDINGLYHNEQWLFFTGAANCVCMGSAFWLLCAGGTDTVVLTMTIICCIYAIGTTINTSVKFGSLPLFLLLNLGQGIALFSGIARTATPEVSVALLGIVTLLINFGRQNSQQIFNSVQIGEQIKQKNIKLEQDNNLIAKALNTAREANEDKSRFLAGASHDLRQPLHAMNIFIATLKNNISTAKHIEIIEKIEHSATALADQFNSLLDLSKFDAGVVASHRANISLDSLLKRIVDDIKPLAKAKNLQIELAINTVSVQTDILLIERLIRNIISNALRYTQQGFISIITETSSEGVHLLIQDTGLGIAEIEQEKIFNDFYQVDNPARNKSEGSGLGLAIVKRISQLLQLDVRLSSTLGVGSTFEVLFPKPQQIKVATSTPENQHNINAHSFTGLDLLVVDDNPDIVEALGGLIETWGCTAICAASYQQACERVNQFGHPDFAIVDDMLGSNESGLDVAIWLSDKMAKERIIIVTGNTHSQRQQEIEQQGFKVYQKPIKADNLYQLVAKSVAQPDTSTV